MLKCLLVCECEWIDISSIQLALFSCASCVDLTFLTSHLITVAMGH